jgi:NAD(P)-dependent dehydrogenase (short-subunit alcohol dehydrogenase family)
MTAPHGVRRFDGTRVLVTGAASGIGRATTVRLVAEGAAVYAVDRDESGLQVTAASCNGPGRVLTATCDVASEPSVVDTVADAVDGLGGLDVLVNVAGIHRTTPLERLAVDDLRELFEVNLVGTALFCREAVRHLPRGGAIVNVASSAAAHGNPYMSAYSASKGAVLAFSLSLAAELVSRGIRVVPVSPGTVATPLTAAVTPGDLDFSYYGRIRSLMGEARPEQVAGVIAFAASDDASYLTGAELRVDGGSHT